MNTSITGTGVDIISIDRIRTNIRTYGQSFISRVFTEEEQEYCRKQSDPAQHYAARFAAKEAMMKTLGAGWGGGVEWTDISIRRAPGNPPDIQLSGEAARLADEQGLENVHVSLSHGQKQAIAFCVGECSTGDASSKPSKT